MEKHHCIPISCQGADIPENIVHLSHEDHQHIHEILNINYSNIRSFRKQTNHILFHTEKSIEALCYLQRLYFGKIHLLKHDLLKLHRIAVERQFLKLCQEHHLKMNVEDYRQKSELAKFHYFLYLYHEALKQIVINHYNDFR